MGNKGRPRNEDRAFKMWKLYTAGFSTNQVGQNFGCSGQNVRRIFKIRGWPTREMRRNNGADNG